MPISSCLVSFVSIKYVTLKVVELTLVTLSGATETVKLV